ncbi:MAG TPA: hypothetical protein VGJ69_04060 [Pyrinomonadaceae bacterium]
MRARLFLGFMILCFAVALCLAGAASVAATRSKVATQEQPTIKKDSIIIWAWKVPSYRGNFDTWSWLPRMRYRVNGPVPSGGQLYVEFSMPGTGPWVKFDCDTGEIDKDHWWGTECGGRNIPEDKSTTYIGPVNFAIKMRNELAGSDVTLFTGKIKVAKIHSNEVGPHAVNRFIYYVDHDWTLPIGYVYLTPDDVYGWKKPGFNVTFWLRGEDTNTDPHLFYQGKDVSRMMWQGELVGKPGCGNAGESETETGTMSDVDDDKKIVWSKVTCSFPTVKGWDRTGEEPGMFGEMHSLAKNPGEYEFKLLWKNHLARSIKFTVRPDGKFDNGTAASNKLGSDRVIVPVTIIGDADGMWDKNAWKTDAFFGNPLTGFTWP